MPAMLAPWRSVCANFAPAQFGLQTGGSAGGGGGAIVVVVVGTSVVVVVNAGASVDDVADGLSVVVVAEGSLPGVAIVVDPGWGPTT